MYACISAVIGFVRFLVVFIVYLYTVIPKGLFLVGPAGCHHCNCNHT